MCVEAVEQEEVVESGDTCNRVADFIEGVQELVNPATRVLTVVEIVGSLELIKNELMAVSRERSLSEALDAAMGEAMLGGNA